MKKNLVTKSLASALLFSAASSAFAASGAVQGGTINFTGTVVDAACAVDINSEHQNISLGQVRLAELKAAGDTSVPMPVKIQLDDCDASVASTATFGFMGQIDSDDSVSLANTSTNAGKASGIGVQMTDASGAAVKFDGSLDTGSKLTLTNGTNTADFSANMVATTASPTVGEVAAAVNFTVLYE